MPRAARPARPAPPVDPARIAVRDPPRIVESAKIMGWVEYVSFPAWKVDAVRAKVDTGARISALHVDSIRPMTDGRIRFEIVLHREQKHLRVTAEARVLRRSRIRSSNGHYEERYVVPARVRMGDVERDIELSLVSRPDMLFRMLLGRDALEGFVIDPTREILLGTPRPSLHVKPAPAPKAVHPPANPKRKKPRARKATK